MCGIIGLFTYNTKNNEVDSLIKSLVQRALFAESLVYMEPRGKDSTGIAMLWDDKEVAVLKQPVEASTFALNDGTWGEDYTSEEDKNAHFKWLMSKWVRGNPRTQLRQALGHVRAGTKGSEYNPYNNHPIIISSDTVGKGGNITGDLVIGVHNGGIRNDDELFKKHSFVRLGEVDSEIIFHLIYQYRNEFSHENLQKTFDELLGAYSVLAYNPANPFKAVGMRETRPLNAAFIPELGTLILISESRFLTQAIRSYERWRIREGSTEYIYTDEDGSKHNLGKIYDTFPYITTKWYDVSNSDTIEPGVFILDLQNEVDSNTKVKDLVTVKKISKPVVSIPVTNNTTYNGYKHAAVAVTPICPSRPTVPIKDTRSGGQIIELPEASAASTKKEQSVTTNHEPLVVDLTDYTEGNIENNPYEEITLEAELSKEVIEVDFEEVSNEKDENDEDNEYNEGCPYSWEECLKIASSSLYSSGPLVSEKFLLGRLNNDAIKEILDKYLIDTDSPDEAAALLASFYDIIFPESFAAGFQQGYNNALEDCEGLNEEEDIEDSLRQENAQLSYAVNINQNTLLSLTAEVKKLKEENETLTKEMSNILNKKNKGQEYIRLMRPILISLLRTSNIIGENGVINHKNFEDLKKSAGLQNEKDFSSLVVRQIIKNKNS